LGIASLAGVARPLDFLLLFNQDTNALHLRYVGHVGHFGGCPAAYKRPPP
jgi:hypothetical protein